jgi:hypothetical protein
MRWGWERLAALSGILAVVLWVIAIAVDEATGGAEEEDAAGVLARFQDDEQAVLVGGWLLQLGALLFLVVVVLLRRRHALAEGRGGILTALGFAGGLGVVLFMLAMPGPEMSGALNNDELTPDAALALSNLGDAFFFGAELSAAVLLAATGLLAVRLRTLPAWYGWVSLVIALWLVILPIGWAALIFVFPLWVLLTSVLLFLRPAAPAQIETTARPAV